MKYYGNFFKQVEALPTYFLTADGLIKPYIDAVNLAETPIPFKLFRDIEGLVYGKNLPKGSYPKSLLRRIQINCHKIRGLLNGSSQKRHVINITVLTDIVNAYMTGATARTPDLFTAVDTEQKPKESTENPFSNTKFVSITNDPDFCITINRLRDVSSSSVEELALEMHKPNSVAALSKLIDESFSWLLLPGTLKDMPACLATITEMRLVSDSLTEIAERVIKEQKYKNNPTYRLGQIFTGVSKEKAAEFVSYLQDFVPDHYRVINGLLVASDKKPQASAPCVDKQEVSPEVPQGVPDLTEQVQRKYIGKLCVKYAKHLMSNVGMTDEGMSCSRWPYRVSWHLLYSTFFKLNPQLQPQDAENAELRHTDEKESVNKLQQLFAQGHGLVLLELADKLFGKY